MINFIFVLATTGKLSTGATNKAGFPFKTKAQGWFNTFKQNLQVRFLACSMANVASIGVNIELQPREITVCER